VDGVSDSGAEEEGTDFSLVSNLRNSWGRGGVTKYFPAILPS